MKGFVSDRINFLYCNWFDFHSSKPLASCILASSISTFCCSICFSSSSFFFSSLYFFLSSIFCISIFFSSSLRWIALVVELRSLSSVLKWLNVPRRCPNMRLFRCSFAPLFCSLIKSSLVLIGATACEETTEDFNVGWNIFLKS